MEDVAWKKSQYYSGLINLEFFYNNLSKVLKTTIVEQESYLKRLIGKSVTNTVIGTSTTFALGKTKSDLPNQRTEIELSIFFEDYYLNIYNPITIIPSDKELLDFIGLKVITINENNNEGELIFDNGSRIIIDLRDEAYYGPEAMSLTGPNNFLVVWN